MKKLLFPFVLLLFAVAVQAQIQDPVKFNSELKILAADEAEVVFTAAIDKGWHVYSTDLGDGGPISATFNVEKIFGAEVVGKLKPVGKEIWNMALATMKTACRPHKFLSSSPARQKGLPKKLPPLPLKRKPKNSPQSRRLSPARLPWLPSAVRTGRRKSRWRTRWTYGSRSSVN